MATGTLVLLKDSLGSDRVRKIRYTWTSDGAGVVVSDAIPASGEGMSGLFLGAETKPGTPAPATPYNFQVRRGGSTSASLDMLNGSGALRSVTLPEYNRPEDRNGNGGVMSVREDQIFVTIDTAGAAKQGEFTLHFLQSA